MKNKCRNCNGEIRQSLKEWILSRWNDNLSLCLECKEIKQWEEDSRLVRGAPTLQLTNGTVLIRKHRSDLYDTLSHELSGKRCAIRLKDTTAFICKVLKVEKGYLMCVKEKSIGTEQSIPVHRIDCYVVISEDTLKFDIDSTRIVKGYKAVELIDGVLGDEKFIYEIGVPYTQEKEDPFDSFYGTTYAHFCTRIEDVIGWRKELINSAIKFCKGEDTSEYRLFEVEATGHCFQNTPDGWVSNHLTLKREVPQREILEYFENECRWRGQGLTSETLDQYREVHVEPYRNDLGRPEIEEMYRAIISRRLKRKTDINFDNWLSEQGFHYIKKSYCYLVLRSDIRNNCFFKDCEEYQYLVNSKSEPQLKAIERLDANKDLWAK